MAVLDFSSEGVAVDEPLDFSKEGEALPDFSSHGVPADAPAPEPPAGTSTPETATEGEPFSPESDYTPVTGQSLREFMAAQSKPFKEVPQPEAPPDAGVIRKAATGLARSGVGAFNALQTPLTAELAAAGALPVVGKPLAVAAGAGFGAHMSIAGAQQFYDAVKAGDVQGAFEGLGNTALGAFMVGGGMKSAKSEAPIVPSGIREAELRQKAADEALASTLPISANTVKDMGGKAEAPSRGYFLGKTPEAEITQPKEVQSAIPEQITDAGVLRTETPPPEQQLGLPRVGARDTQLEEPARTLPEERIAPTAPEEAVLGDVAAKAEPDLLRPGPGAETIGADQPPKTFTTSNKNAVVDAERQRRGLPPMMKVERLSNQESWDNAMAKIEREPEWQDRLLTELKDKPRAITPEENAALLQRRIDLENEYEKALTNWKEANDANDTARATDEASRIEHWSKQLTDLEEITGKGGTGTESGRSLQARSMMADERYRLVRMQMETEAARGRPLNTEELSDLKRAHDKIVATQKAFEEYVAKSETRQAELEASVAAEKMAKEARPLFHPRIIEIAERITVSLESSAVEARARLMAKLGQLGAAPDPTIISDLAIIGAAKLARGTVEFGKWSEAMIRDLGPKVEELLKDAFEAAKAKFEQDVDTASKKQNAPSVKEAVKRKQAIKSTQQDIISAIEEQAKSGDIEDFPRYIKELAKNFVEDGVRGLEPLTDAIEGVVKPLMPEITRRQIQDAFSDYGKSKAATTVPTKVEMAQLRGEAQKVSALADIIEKQQAPMATGQQRVPMSDRARRLTKEINEAKKKYNIQPTDPARQLKSSLDAIKSRLNNAIKDAEFELATRKKIVRTKNQVPSDAETTALRTRLEDLRSQLAEIFPKEPMSDETRLKIALRVAEKSEANWAKRLEEARKGNFETGKPMPKKVTSAELEAIHARRDAAREEVKLLKDSDPTIQESKAAQELETRRQALEKQIAEIQAKVAAKDISTKQPKLNRPLLPELEQAKQRLEKVNAELAQMRKDARPKKTPEQIALQSLKTRLTNRIAELQDRMARGDFKPKPKRVLDISQDPKAVALKAEAEHQKALYDRALAKDRYKNLPLHSKIYAGAKESLNLLRTVKTSWDVSAVLSQGGFIVTGHPVRAARAVGAMFKALVSERQARNVQEQIFLRRNAPLYKQSKLYLPDLNEIKLSAQEEMIMSRLAEKIPGVRASNRAFIVFLNKLRADSFDAMLASRTKSGRFPTPDALNAISNYINVATGRGDLGKAAAAAEVLATVFFSPRLVASRFQLLFGQPLFHGDAQTRRMVALEYGRFLSGLAVIYGLGQIAGAKVETDRRSSDFGKLKFGNTRVDPLVGLSQNTVFLSRFFSGKTKTVGGKIIPARSSDTTIAFLRNKLSPILGTGYDVRDIAVGQKPPAGHPQTVGEMFAPRKESLYIPQVIVPISMGEIYAIMKEHGMPEGAAIEILNLFGMHVQNFDDKKKK